MIKRLTFWMLFPFVLPQALVVRKRAPRFPGAAGPATGSVGSGEPCTLLAIGDSLVAGVGANELHNALVGQSARAISARFTVRVEWCAFGKSGTTSRQVLKQLLPQLPTQQFSVVIVSVGVNDVTGLKRSAAFDRYLRKLLAELHAHSPNAQIAVAGLPPLSKFPLLPRPLRWLFGLRAQTFDAIVRQATEDQPGAMHIPVDFDIDPEKFAADGYHPSESGYAELGEAIGERLLHAELNKINN